MPFRSRSRTPVICPICPTVLPLDASDRTGFGHFATHLDDTAGPGSPLKLGCGCRDAVFGIDGDFPSEVLRHIRTRHQVKLPI